MHPERTIAMARQHQAELAAEAATAQAARVLPQRAGLSRHLRRRAGLALIELGVHLAGPAGAKAPVPAA
ncbi:MAG: hypothetical protein M0004_01000 [Actinomycetota bacterium]|nr:hypothetical protein [Actinomycetota bacterium]